MWCLNLIGVLIEADNIQTHVTKKKPILGPVTLMKISGKIKIMKFLYIVLCFLPLRLGSDPSSSTLIEEVVIEPLNNHSPTNNRGAPEYNETIVNKINATPTRMVPDKEEDEVSVFSNGKPDLKRVVNFASIGAGAVVLESPAQAKGYSNLLNEDKDKYGISPCSEKKWVVIGLSEDIMVHTVVLANYEKYSSLLRDFQVMGSSSYPVSEWLDLGTYSAEPRLGEQVGSVLD